MPRPLAAVLFDLDCTLTDRARTVQAYARFFVRDYGARFRIEGLAAVAAELQRIDDNGYNRRRAEDLAAHPAFTDAPSADELAAHWFDHFAEATVARAGAQATLGALAARGLKLGVVTNGPRIKQQRKIDVLGVRDLLGAVLVSAEVGLEKPDPRMFHAAAAALEVEPERCLFIGDNPRLDVLGAEAAGMRAVWLPAEIPWPAELPPARTVVHTLPELLEVEGLR